MEASTRVTTRVGGLPDVDGRCRVVFMVNIKGLKVNGERVFECWQSSS